MDNLCKAIELIANTLTAILGGLALYGLIWHRKKISAFIRLLAHAVVSDRIKRIRNALTRLDQLDYNSKEDRREIIAIMGELAGMIRTLINKNPDIQRLYDEIVRLTTTNPENLSETTKRRISQELYSIFDEQAITAAFDLMEVSNGSKTN